MRYVIVSFFLYKPKHMDKAKNIITHLQKKFILCYFLWVNMYIIQRENYNI